MNKKLKFAIIGFGIGFVIFLVLVPYVVKYYYSPERIAERFKKGISDFIGADVVVGDVSIDPRSGIKFLDVKLLMPEGKGIEYKPEYKLLFSVHKIYLKFRKGPFGLGVRVRKVEIEEPIINLVYDEKKRKWNWGELGLGEKRVRGVVQTRLNIPAGVKFALKGGIVVLAELYNRRDKCKKIVVNISAIPKDEMYEVVFSANVLGKDARISGYINYDVDRSAILEGNVRVGRIDNIRSFLPYFYLPYFDRVVSGGVIEISDIKYLEGQPEVRILLNKVDFNVPISNRRIDFSGSGYLLKFSGISGEVVLNSELVGFDNLVGRYENSEIKISGSYSLKGATQCRLHFICKGLEVPNYDDPKIRKIVDEHFPGKVRGFLRNFRPVGKADVDITLRTESINGKLRHFISGTVIPLGSSAEYVKFPYRMNDIRGKILILNNKFFLNDLEGVSEGGKIKLSGYISEPSKSAEVSLVIFAKDVPLSKKLYSALSERYKKLWVQFHPEGRADATIMLDKPSGESASWNKQISLKLKDVKGWYDKFPYPLEDANAEIDIHNTRANVVKFVGSRSGSRVSIKGYVNELDKSVPSVELTINAKDVPINQDLLKALPTSAADLIRDCNLKGKVNLTGWVKVKEGVPLKYEFYCQFDKMEMVYKNFPYKITNISGKLTILPNQVIINGAFAESGEQKVSARGRIRILGDRNEIALDIYARGVKVDAPLYNALPVDLRRIWAKFDPSGRIDVRLDLKADGERLLSLAGEVSLVNCDLFYEKSVRVDNLFGKVVFEKDKISFRDIRGRMMGKPASLSGELVVKDRVKRGKFKIEISRMLLDENVIKLLCRSRCISLLKLQAGGIAHFDISDLSVSVDSNGDVSWCGVGKMVIKGVKVGLLADSPVDIGFNGKFSWDGHKPAFGVDGNLSLSILDLNVGRVERVLAYVYKELENPGLVIKRVSGKYCGGRFSGIGKLAFGEEIRYSLQVLLKDVLAGQAFGLKGSKSPVRGKLSGEIFFEGILGQKYPEQGGGKVDIIGIEVLRLPLFARIYSRVRKEPVNLTAFHDVRVEFALEKYIAKMYKITMVGPALSLVGSGRFNLSNRRLKLRFISAPPEVIKKLPVLKDLAVGASSELTVIEVSGDVDSPKIETKSLSNFTGTLQMFLEGK